jgi:hypothetical protein
MWTSGNPLHTNKIKIEVLNIESCRIGIDKAQWMEIRFLISKHSCSQILINLLQSFIRNPEANQKINIQIVRAKFVLMSFKNGVVIFLQSGFEYSIARSWLHNHAMDYHTRGTKVDIGVCGPEPSWVGMATLTCFRAMCTLVHGRAAEYTCWSLVEVMHQ